uniref:Uncharacterized protein n=1 Tax=Picea sitchensis TaxID=3332 RepID=D5AC96_PICSI|nr:unknown [Picea sitchensis]
MSKLLDRVISVEYAIRDDDDRNGQRESPGRRGGYGKRVSPAYDRSVSPIYGRQGRRPSPDYGRAPSPIYERYRGSVNDRIHSPINDRYRSRSPVRRSRTGGY